MLGGGGGFLEETFRLPQDINEVEMFTHHSFVLMIARERISDLQRQAEVARMARDCVVRNSATGFHRRLLSGLGGAMVNVGSRLEAYGSPQKGSDYCPEVVD